MPVSSVEPAAVTVKDVPASPAYGAPANAVGPTISGAEEVSPEELYALTLTVCRPLEKGSGIEQLQVPSACYGANP